MSALSFWEDASQFITPIPDSFILEHMPSSNGVYVKVYLSVFYAYSHRVPNFSFAQVAKDLNILESEVLEALRHWNARGCLRLSYNNTEDAYCVSFSSHMPEDPTPDDSGDRKSFKAQNSQTKVIRVAQAPIYSQEELSLYSQNAEIKKLFHEVSQLLGTQLSQSFCAKIFSFYDYYRLPVDVIIYMVDYCVSMEKRDLRYIEKVALDWSDNDIHSIEDAEKYVNRILLYKPILQAMHAYPAIPTGDQVKIFDQWHLEYGMGIEVLVEAAARTYERTHQAKFSYTKSIVEKWHAQGITTMQGVLAEDANFSAKGTSRGTKAAANSRNGYKDNKYIPSNNYDYDEILAEHRRRLYDQYDQIKEN